MAEVHELVDRVLNDAAFRQALLDDPEGTLQANGIEPTPEILENLKGVDHDSLVQLARDFGNENISGGPC
jgi:hypothetical protein